MNRKLKDVADGIRESRPAALLPTNFFFSRGEQTYNAQMYGKVISQY